MNIEIEEGKTFVAVICGEDETRKKRLADEIVNGRDSDFFVFRNLENNNHPRIQSMSANSKAKWIAEENLHYIFMTNSFHYLEAFVFYLKKYGVTDNVHFYLVKNNGEVSVSQEPYEVMDNLAEPSYALAREKQEYELEGE